MGLRTIAGQIKTALALKRVADEFEKEKAMNHDWAKTLKAAGIDFLLTCAAVLVAYFADPVNLAAALDLVPEHLRIALVPILSAVFVAIRKRIKHGGPVNPDIKAGALAGALALCLIASPAMAQEPAAAPTNTLRLSSGATRFFTPGVGDTTEIEGQIAVEMKAPAAVTVEGFGRFTRTQGTEIAAAGLLDINTFRSIIAHVAIRREVTPHFEGICSSGVSWSRDKAFDPQDPRVWAVGCGARGSLKGKGSLTVKVGHNGSVGGPGVFGELVINQGPGIRYLATYAVPFDAARFRRNPGTFTGGVQVDVWTRGF